MAQRVDQYAKQPDKVEGRLLEFSPPFLFDYFRYWIGLNSDIDVAYQLMKPDCAINL